MSEKTGYQPLRVSGRVAIGLSFTALLAVLSGYFHSPQSDEGAAAHIFQLVMVALAPTILLFLATADWRQPWRSARRLTLPAATLVLAFGAPVLPGALPVSRWLQQIDSRRFSGDNLASIMFAEILTEHLALRELEASDAQRIFEYRSRADVSRFQSWGTQSADAIQVYIRDLSGMEPGRPGSWYQIGIILLSSRELIGDCGFQVLETEPLQAELGIALAPEFQGRGYATETLRALLGYLLVALGMDRVFGSVDPRNIRSMRLLQRVGMRKEAHRVKSLWFKGEWVDDVIFAITASEWKSSNKTN